MNRLIILAFAACTTTALAADRHFERTLPTSKTPSVSIAAGSGTIHLHHGDESKVRIQAHVHANSGGWLSGSSQDSDRRINEIADHPPIQQSGNDIIIGERQPRDLFRNITIDYDVTVPHEASLSAFTGSGDIDTDDVGQSIRAETGSGNIQVSKVRGPAALHTGSGDIQLEEAAQGDVQLETGSGSIHAKGLMSGLRAHSGSGDIDLEGHPSSEWRVQTGSGGIRLDLGSDARFNLDASTGSGDIQVRQSLSARESNRRHLSGTANGGGPLLRLSTGSGNIEVR